jgi:hypothetical protein
MRGGCGDNAKDSADASATNPTREKAGQLANSLEARISRSRGALHAALIRRLLCSAPLFDTDARRRDIMARAVAETTQMSMLEWLAPAVSVVHSIAATLTTLRFWREHNVHQDAASVATIIDRPVFAPLAGSKEPRS